MMTNEPGNIRIVFHDKDVGFHGHIVTGKGRLGAADIAS
jgi:hypothetical protein